METEERMNVWSGLRRPTLIECVLIQKHKNEQICPESLKDCIPFSLKNEMVLQTKIIILPQCQNSSGKISDRLDR